jgi:hypothetical protein
MHAFVLLDNKEKNIFQSIIICIDYVNALPLQIHVLLLQVFRLVYQSTIHGNLQILLFVAAPIQTDLCCYGDLSK